MSSRKDTFLMLLAAAGLILASAACRKETPTSPSVSPPPPPSTEIYVDASNGNDATGSGTSASPYRTIGLALSKSSSGMTIIVRPGSYSAASSESFPLKLQAGVTLAGEAAEQVIVDGGGSDHVLEDASQCRVEKLTIRGGSRAGVLLQNASTLASCVLRENAGGVICESSATVESNVIDGNSGFGLSVRQAASPLISGNTISSNGGDGVECAESSTPTLRGNTVRENRMHGVVCTDSSAPRLESNTVTTNALPEVYILFDARPTISGNTIRGNERYNIDDARSPNKGQITAVGNTWDAPQPTGTVSGPADFRPNYFIKEAGNSIKFSE